ncbi:MAG: universal stress protein [Candidatus Promineifilaceae bacterium]
MARQKTKTNKRKPDLQPAAAELAAADALRRRAAELSLQWGQRLDHFELPCPLCRGEMIFQGVFRDHLYEFAEGEPGVINELDVLPITFICNRCGYTAEFDTELFNPAYLAELEGAPADAVEALRVRDYRALVPLSGAEESSTLLDLAGALAGVRGGEVLVFNAARNEAQAGRLRERLSRYRPAIGAPAPHLLEAAPFDNLGAALAQAAAHQACDLLLIDGLRAGRGDPQRAVAGVIREILRDNLCDVAIVHDRGLPAINRILVATAGGPNAPTAAQLAVNLAAAYSAEVHFLNVASAEDPEAMAAGQARVADTLREVLIPDHVRYRARVVLGRNPVRSVVEEAAQYDLFLVGDSPRDWRGQVVLESFSAKVARNCSQTAIIVLGRHSPVRSWLSWLLGS